jgi:hypothetical protein
MAFHFNDPPYWRDRAQELRVLADRLEDSDVKQMLLRCAQDYDVLAERAEERLRSLNNSN